MKTTLLLIFIVALMGPAVGLDSEKMLKKLFGKTKSFPHPYIVGIKVGLHPDHPLAFPVPRGDHVVSPPYKWCNGVLIKPDIVLTAAHCLSPLVEQPGLPVVVTAGTTNPMVDEGTKILANKMYMPPGFNYRSNIMENKDFDDIGLLKLRQPFKVKNNSPINVIDLPTGTEIIDDEIVPIPTLRADGKELCFIETKLKDIFYTNKDISPKTFHGLVVKEGVEVLKHHGFRNGDSGSSVVVNGTVVGVLSNLMSTVPSVQVIFLTKVSGYLDFIKGVIQNKLTKDTIELTVSRHWRLDYHNKKYELIATS